MKVTLNHLVVNRKFAIVSFKNGKRSNMPTNEDVVVPLGQMCDLRCILSFSMGKATMAGRSIYQKGNIPGDSSRDFFIQTLEVTNKQNQPDFKGQ